jgi:predicted GNAT family acetyltransferase
MESAIVYTGSKNTAARALYESVGFRLVGEDYDWVKRIS